MINPTTDPVFIIVDLFCGAGGTTTGFVQAELEGNGIAKVIACVNHDPKAIKSHWQNHQEVKHFEEDIRTLDLTELIKLVNDYRKKYPNALLILWASLECTNFSKAKGGQPRDADSRTLADHLERYILALNPDYVQIENVVEFMSWGPLDENGKPISKRNGEDWMRWKGEICAMGYVDQWKELNSANFGAYTSRNRLFGVFARPWLPISFPEPTHSKNPSILSMHGDLLKWKAVKEVLNFSDEGESIFTRKKPLSDKTLERISAGLKKFVATGETKFLAAYYGNGDNISSTEDPCPVIPTKDRFGFINCTSYILNPSHGGHSTSTQAPCPVIVARQDKAPLYLVQCEKGKVAIAVYEGDSKAMIRIKQFMAMYELVDIKMRMLRVLELLNIQGFPTGYILEGNQSDQKKFIGNSVVPQVVKCWTEALAQRIIETRENKAA
jgi:DNA (cytosine-5)-methyltransferase 1